MGAALGRDILHVRDIPRSAAFYGTLFGDTPRHRPGDRIVALAPDGVGAEILFHPAAKGQRGGQSRVKPVFDVADVGAFRDHAAAQGIAFGPVHEADGYGFANVKDPDGNAVSVSSRAFARDSHTGAG